jgi:hypothetical protein
MITLFKDLRNLRYTNKCFKMILDNDLVNQKYNLKEGDVIIKNPKKTRLGVLYVFIPINGDIAPKHHDQTLSTELDIMNEILLAMMLHGTIMTTKRAYQKADDDDNYMYLIKFIPVFRFLRARYMVMDILLLLASIVALKVLLHYVDFGAILSSIWKFL